MRERIERGRGIWLQRRKSACLECVRSDRGEEGVQGFRYENCKGFALKAPRTMGNPLLWTGLRRERTCGEAEEYTGLLPEV